MPSSIGRDRFVGQLNRLVRRPSIELELLAKLWPAVEKHSEIRRRRLIRSIPDDDPMRLRVDFMHPIKRVSDENLHTQALAYALDPLQEHRFGNSVLLSLVEKMAALHARSGAARVLHSIRKSRTQISVRPEYRYRIEVFRKRSIARSDIWIEMHARKKSGLVVIENKIKASESDGQLTWYEHKAEKWCRARGHDRYLLIYLTPDGLKPSTSKSQRWVTLSYLQLASALRNAWIDNRHAPGARWLGMYIASITRGVLGIDLDQRNGITIDQINTYKEKIR